MLSPDQLMDLVIRPTLAHLDPEIPHTEEAEELLLGTAITESGLQYLQQLGGGPALGLWQMEPATERDIWDNFLGYRGELELAIDGLEGRRTLAKAGGALTGNLFYAAAMARVHYYRVSEPLPLSGDLEAQADYWKRHYNTDQGAGTVEHYIEAVTEALHSGEDEVTA
ncbi:hypothetical protein SAMN05660831_02066 [Thiohalospira halophila DSM 15071]|uniref:Transglycosylase SLT domain-containing protein n=1 Tax=Thiohalospira halophila DSM 15071 TaxID=1123397 RepID=A0A1I1U8V7_9GAMM|nr:hypothetical protein [Thiohalospira halophila]SFD67104.1 hypothetical protein SAMN05660831_02066 [Thiohalospira halophila DSM 15071]